jgi:hypothetical protein
MDLADKFALGNARSKLLNLNASLILPTPMEFNDDRESDLDRREHKLRQREMELRLRELETELSPPPYETRKHYESNQSYQTVSAQTKLPEKRWTRWMRKVKKIGLFLGTIIAVLVVLRIASWLATFVMVIAALGVLYIIVFGKDEA